MFLTQRVLRKLDELDERIGRIEEHLRSAGLLRAELEAKKEEVAALSAQGLHVVQLLDEARREIARLRAGQA